MSDLPSLRRSVAARHILSSPTVFARTRPHLSGGRIDWSGILAEIPTMSGGERFLVDVARRLFSGESLPGPYALSGQLDVLNARRVAEAQAYLTEDEPPDLARAA